MTSDDELMRLAAIAYGAKADEVNKGFYYDPVQPSLRGWQPLVNDEDAFRLMTKLKISLTFFKDYIFAINDETGHTVWQPIKEINQSVRMAIVSCAAIEPALDEQRYENELSRFKEIS